MSKNVSKIIKEMSVSNVVGVFFTLIVFVFILENTYGLRAGVKITVSGIENKATYENSVIEISGNARHANNLTISGNSVSVDMDGNFKSHVVLSEGINVISFNAGDSFGDSTSLTYTVFRKSDTEQV